jgi:hypothetical protein
MLIYRQVYLTRNSEWDLKISSNTFITSGRDVIYIYIYIGDIYVL